WCVEARSADDDAPMGAAADWLEFVARGNAEGDGATLNLRHLRGCRDPQSDRCRRGMAHIELNAQALMSARKQLLDRGERRRFDEIDHHWRRQDRDPARADKGRGMLRSNHD